ncbi:glycerol kinase GlpK [Hornefia butyriciproducens]|uniref:Glycerol kinase n=1 Tax=Hornefia butyriciproducens TaxID=2652293 RepID=A0A6L5Y5M8_9FIRM|nr:glycerol kinase GlpK [Hornefia butyriciproducens]MCI7326176.1 glycerol kinase GlpK [Clostridiales bacterium]MCI7678876.1 glycerol kinase GlpK [Clostridiales bacterium]MDD6299637.1 glycerol kinase GlpK [Hornefia butyriciproducens]MDD7020711.1 glycerol kinase GlpK [Hornefia butyriciproducens]MDY2990825.1 glycerol kinase GlpK [Hornefia butyriciproducens]
MAGKYYLGLDSGTTGTTALVMDQDWNVAGRGYKELTQRYPHPGWVEHDAMEIWDSVLYAVSEACRKAGINATQLRCIGIDNQGETVVLWDKTTGIPVYNAIVWQDRRTAKYADSITEKYGNMVREKTGLMIDAYFSATKIRWIIDNVPGVREKIKEKKILAGTLDTWLIWKLTHGQVFVTDVTTASRTMLMNIHTGQWDQDILDALDIDKSMLAEICDSSHIYGKTDPLDFFGTEIPISGSAVDQQAALFGQACYKPGAIKCTYGTGCFMLMNTGDKPIYSRNGILTTVAWGLNGKMTFALDGGVYVTGAATQWLRDGLKIIDNADQTEAMAVAAGNNGDVYFVPAFSGLAAPHWDSYARGTIIGITGGTTREQIVRACLEATAYQVKDNLDVMKLDANIPITAMRVDGGAVANGFLMQFQADILGIPVDIAAVHDTTPLGAAYLAALAIGDFHDLDEIQAKWKLERSYEPKMSVDERETLLYKWHKAVERSKNWAED